MYGNENYTCINAIHPYIPRNMHDVLLCFVLFCSYCGFLEDECDVFIHIITRCFTAITMDHFVYALSQWETTLQCNVASHWLGACTEWLLIKTALKCIKLKSIGTINQHTNVHKKTQNVYIIHGVKCICLPYDSRHRLFTAFTISQPCRKHPTSSVSLGTFWLQSFFRCVAMAILQWYLSNMNMIFDSRTVPL